MLKFLENRESPKRRRGKDVMRFESNSHLPNNKYFNSPIHQDALLQNDKPQYYLMKKLPPLQIYNPLIQQTESIDRPEFILKQKDIYSPRYQREYQQYGFKKKAGIFESFQHLLNQNCSLIQGVHQDKKPLSLPAVRRKVEQATISQQYSTRSKKIS